MQSYLSSFIIFIINRLHLPNLNRFNPGAGIVRPDLQPFGSAQGRISPGRNGLLVVGVSLYKRFIDENMQLKALAFQIKMADYICSLISSGKWIPDIPAL